MAGLVSHITMRITVMKQMAKGLAKEPKPSANSDGRPAAGLEKKGIEKELQSLKWNLWHGNVERALERIEDLQWDLELTAGGTENRTKLLKQLSEFNGYIQNNREFIRTMASDIGTGSESQPDLWNRQ